MPLRWLRSPPQDAITSHAGCILLEQRKIKMPQPKPWCGQVVSITRRSPQSGVFGVCCWGSVPRIVPAVTRLFVHSAPHSAPASPTLAATGCTAHPAPRHLAPGGCYHVQKGRRRQNKHSHDSHNIAAALPGNRL